MWGKTPFAVCNKSESECDEMVAYPATPVGAHRHWHGTSRGVCTSECRSIGGHGTGRDEMVRDFRSLTLPGQSVTHLRDGSDDAPDAAGDANPCVNGTHGLPAHRLAGLGIQFSSGFSDI
jgi:hypothetical protein